MADVISFALLPAAWLVAIDAADPAPARVTIDDVNGRKLISIKAHSWAEVEQIRPKIEKQIRKKGGRV